MKRRYYVHHHDAIPALDYVRDTLQEIEQDHQEAEECRSLYPNPIKGFEIELNAIALTELLGNRADPGDTQEDGRPAWEQGYHTPGVKRIL